MSVTIREKQMLMNCEMLVSVNLDSECFSEI